MLVTQGRQLKDQPVLEFDAFMAIPVSGFMSCLLAVNVDGTSPRPPQLSTRHQIAHVSAMRERQTLLCTAYHLRPTHLEIRYSDPEPCRSGERGRDIFEQTTCWISISINISISPATCGCCSYSYSTSTSSSACQRGGGRSELTCSGRS